MRNRLLGWSLSLAFLTVLVAGVAAAQRQYAPPAISIVDTRLHDKDVLPEGRGLFRLTLAITAGSDGAPAGFTVQWMKKSDYDALGGWAADGDPRLKYCQCFGPYTLNQWAGSPTMGAGETSYLQLGDLADEGGLYGNDYNALQSGTGYVIRGYTEGDGNGDASVFSSLVLTSTLSSECTQGFWKTHGPAPCTQGNNNNVWPSSCFPMTLGTVSYTEAQICSILLQPVGSGSGANGLISLAHQLITTLLNGCSTSDLTPVLSTIAAANSLIGSLVVPPVGSDFLSPSVTSSLTETLDDYNNGLLGGVGNCPTPVTKTTWGKLQAIYR